MKRQLLVVGLVAAIAFYAGTRYSDPRPLVIAPPVYVNRVNLCMVGMDPDSLFVHGILLVGPTSNDVLLSSPKRRIPPRCREVPKGSGCIDWLEPGEKDWPEKFLWTK